MDEAYIPVPFSEHLIDPQEFHDILATLDVCTLPRPTQFCDPDGNDIIPIRMLRVYHNLEDSSLDYDSSIKKYYKMDHDPHTSRTAETTDEKSSFMQNHGTERQIGNTSPSKTSLSMEHKNSQMSDDATDGKVLTSHARAILRNSSVRL